MTQCLTKNIGATKNDRAFTMVELVMAVAFSVLLLTGVYGFYTIANQSYSSGISGQNLQDGADMVMSKIIEGQIESGVVYRLATAVSYMIPNGTPNYLYTCGGGLQTTACNASNTSGEIYYCQDNPCSQTGGLNDTSARWYYLNSTGTSIVYHHPAVGGGTVEQIIYTAPKGSSMILRFEPAAISPSGSPLACPAGTIPVPSSGTPQVCLLPNDVEIDVALRQNLSATTQITNNRTNVISGSGSASTFVLLRNHL